MGVKKEGEEIKPEEIKVDENIETPPDGYTAEEWADLSETEKAGIIDSINAPEGEEEPEPEPEPSKEDEEALAAIAAEAENKPGEKAPDEKKPDEKKEKVLIPDTSDEELLAFRPTLTDEEKPKPAVVEEDIPAEIQAKFTELDQKFDDGDITRAEYNAQRDKLNRQIVKHNIDLENDAKSAAREQENDILWKKEQMFFLSKKPEYFATKATDAVGKAKANAMFGALNEMVKSFSVSDPHLSGMQLLIKADKAVKEVFGVKPAEKKAEEKKADEKKDEGKPPAKIPDVKTLGDVPNASSNMDGVDDSFAQIDKLKGEDYENALEKMPEKVRDSYLKRASK
jgi:hypothetical protein